MKKFLSLFVSILLVASVFCMGASAETGLNAYEEQLVEKLSQSVVNAGGYEVSIPASYVNQAKNYFISSVDMTETEYDAIVALLNDGIAMVKAEDGTKISNYDYDVKADLLECGQKMVDVIGMDLTYNGSDVVIVDEAGKVAFSDDPVLKVTGGMDVSVMPALVVVAVLATLTVAGVVVTKKATSAK